MAAETFARMLPFSPGSDFLEVGSGTGLIAVLAALAGVRRVVALDITPEAVANTRANAEKHGVSGRAEARHGDALQPAPP